MDQELKELKQVYLNDLRVCGEDSFDQMVLEKSVFGGYKVKAVNEYIKALKECLANAERSFSNRLEEYSSMTSMLTQERDKYLKLINEKNDNEKNLKEHNEALEKENYSLNLKIKELYESVLDEEEALLYEQTLTQNEEMKIKIKDCEEKIAEFEAKSKECEASNTILDNEVSQMELTIADLNKQIEDLKRYEITKRDYEVIVSENEMIKKQYGDTLSENSILLAEKNYIIEQNKRMTEDLDALQKKNMELWEINTKIKLKTRKMMSAFESKIYEVSQCHKQNIEQITENIKKALNILNYENMDITKLLNGTDEDLDLELFGETEDNT